MTWNQKFDKRDCFFWLPFFLGICFNKTDVLKLIVDDALSEEDVELVATGC